MRPETKRASKWLIGSVVAFYTAFALSRRIAMLLYTHTRNPLDVAAVLASIVLLSLAIWQMLKANIRNAAALFIVEALLGLFIFIRIDLPFTRDLGNRIGPPIAISATYLVDRFEPQARRGNAFARLDSRNGKERMSDFSNHYLNLKPEETFRFVSECEAYLKQKVELGIDSEPLVADVSMLHADAYCAHLGHNEPLAMQKYAQVAPNNHPAYTAALMAYEDGDLFAAKRFIRLLRSGTPADQDIYGRTVREANRSPFAEFARQVR